MKIPKDRLLELFQPPRIPLPELAALLDRSVPEVACMFIKLLETTEGLLTYDAWYQEEDSIADYFGLSDVVEEALGAYVGEDQDNKGHFGNKLTEEYIAQEVGTEPHLVRLAHLVSCMSEGCWKFQCLHIRYRPLRSSTIYYSEKRC